jgi:acetylornithine deacetylase/succinyl-diaminopimelate desuccinylase-like protein
MLVRIGATLLLLWTFGLTTPLEAEKAQVDDKSAGAPGVLPEPARRLQEYLQIDTTNPPGNEKKAAELLAGWLREMGGEPRLLTSPAGRSSVYARFRGQGGCAQGGGALVLLHHLDVVTAGDGWQVPPFSGRLEGGRIWGRGALDTKSLGVAHLTAIEQLLAAGRPFCRDLVFLGVADEEAGGGEGAAFLLERHPELFAGVDAVINEGGSNRTFGGRQLYWGIEVMQKRALWLSVTAGGAAGHGSRYVPGSAAHQLIRGLAKLVDRPPRYRLGDAARLYFGELARLEGKQAAEAQAALAQQIHPDGPVPPLPAGTAVFFLDTLQVTEVSTGDGINVVSPVARAYLDVRLLPDTDQETYLAEMRALLGPDLTVEVVLDSPPGLISPRDHPLYQTFEKVLGQRAPVIPSFLPGATDSRYFRARGIAAYGFSPFSIEGKDLGGIHAPNEYIRLEDFLRGIETTRRLIEAYAVAP